jgi:hypothetical protein
MSFSVPGEAAPNYGNTPAAPLYQAFTETSKVYPQNLVGVSAAVGLEIVEGLHEGRMGWSDVAESRLEGVQLDTAVAVTVREHLAVGFRGNDRLAGILPHVYAATVGNVVTSVNQLFRADGSSTLGDDTVAPATPAQLAAAERYLMEGDGAEERRLAAAGLLRAVHTALHDPQGSALAVAEDYRNALLGNSSDRFPDARTTPVVLKRELLAHHLRPTILRSIEAVPAAHQLPWLSLADFAYNITRP